jgi:hypothetical protein
MAGPLKHYIIFCLKNMQIPAYPAFAFQGNQASHPAYPAFAFQGKHPKDMQLATWIGWVIGSHLLSAICSSCSPWHACRPCYVSAGESHEAFVPIYDDLSEL